MTLTASASSDVQHMLHPWTNLVRHQDAGPLVIVRGEGCRVYDEAGKDYIEAMAGLWCTALGWGEERLAAKAAEQMRQLAYYHLFNSKSHEPAIRLAEMLATMAPVKDAKVFFANSGSEANDTAIKMIRYINNALGRPKKKKLIARERAYHGVTVATAGLTGMPANHASFDLPGEGVVRAPCPHYWRNARPGETEDQFVARLADELEKLILAEGPDTIAAFFAEPVQGAGGVIIPPANYFAKIQPVLKKYDILLVVDEVITGFGRTGNMFGSETYGIEPDMMSMAKGLSSGYLPISALLVKGELYDIIARESARIGTFGHGYTYGGHPVPCAVAVETLTIYQERDIISHVRKVAPAFQAGLRALAQHPLVGEARGIGLIGAVELVADRDTKQAFDMKQGIGARVVAKTQSEGVIQRAIGDSLAFSPPLVITEEEITEMFARFRRGLDSAYAELRSEGAIVERS